MPGTPRGEAPSRRSGAVRSAASRYDPKGGGLDPINQTGDAILVFVRQNPDEVGWVSLSAIVIGTGIDQDQIIDEIERLCAMDVLSCKWRWCTPRSSWSSGSCFDGAPVCAPSRRLGTPPAGGVIRRSASGFG